MKRLKNIWFSIASFLAEARDVFDELCEEFYTEFKRSPVATVAFTLFAIFLACLAIGLVIAAIAGVIAFYLYNQVGFFLCIGGIGLTTLLFYSLHRHGKKIAQLNQRA